MRRVPPGKRGFPFSPDATRWPGTIRAVTLCQVPVRVWAELGRALLSLAEVVALGIGAVVELDRRLEDPLDLYVNGLRLGHGELEIVDEEWAVRVDAVTGLGEPAATLG